MKKTVDTIVIRDFITNLKEQVKENKKDIRECIKDRTFSHAAFLESVNNTLEYVIDELKDIIKKDKYVR